MHHHESYPAASASHNASFYDAMMDRLASHGAATTVLTVAPAEAQRIFDAAKRHNIMSSDKYLWIGSNYWMTVNLRNVPIGSLDVTVYSLNVSQSMASRFMSLWRSLDPSEYPDLDGDRSTLSSYSSYAVDAVFALALAFQQTINSNYVGSAQGMRQDVYDRLVDSVEFGGVSGIFHLNANGDREGSIFQIRNYEGDKKWTVIGCSDP
jgi:ABC-type branched-subunit amino acid transport system substrate-binding protein